jgi:hypothetical protein
MLLADITDQPVTVGWVIVFLVVLALVVFIVRR